MIVTGWSNGSPNNTTGAGYGIRVSRQDRDRYFQREWPFVTIELGNRGATEANLSSSFWRGCAELRGREIGKFLLDYGLAPWPKGKPPKMKLEIIRPRVFRLSRNW